MSDKPTQIIIEHAYDGFLYAPLFLAKALELFPANCELHYSRGDVPAIQALCNYHDPHKNHWFAICDPFCAHVRRAVPRGRDEEICLVGTVINTAPIWLFNINPKVTAVNRESDLQEYRHIIGKIITYPSDTTGFLFGERIRKNFFSGIINRVTPVPFGSEFDSLDHETLVVTSDVLRIVIEDRKDRTSGSPPTNPIIFRYPEKGPPETMNFLFTGILTLRKAVVEENLDVLLNVMRAIKKCMHLLSQRSVDPLYINALAEHDSIHDYLLALGLAEEEHQRCVREALSEIQRLQIYPNKLTPDASAFTNAEEQWRILRGGIVAYVEPLCPKTTLRFSITKLVRTP